MHDMKEFNFKPFDKGFSYESPITYHIREIYDKQMAERENAITIRVSEIIGVDVNREELIKALNYDRQQYEKGYADAKAEYESTLNKTRTEIEQEITYKPMEMWDYRMGLKKALDIIDKCRKGQTEE